MSDGLFLESVREVAKKYPTVEFKEMIIDNTCMQVPVVITNTARLYSITALLISFSFSFSFFSFLFCHATAGPEPQAVRRPGTAGLLSL
jgi:hypothetical protein